MSSPREQLQAALGDSYRIERELGGGGMSHVFVAEETRLKRKVVIKLLPPEASAAVHADRFTREIELAASLSHPHIVPLLSAGEAAGLLWYAMPFIEGESLADRIRREGSLPPGDVVRIVRDVADALAEAHEHGVVHRDIKPANILLRGRHALVADFGVAKALEAGQDVGAGDRRALTGLGIALGTPAYMAPEQAAADPNTDHRADIYALGVVAYEALTGRLPFDGDTAQELIAAHIATPPIDIRVSRPSITPELAEAVMRCLAKRPSDRWKSAEALATWCERQGTPSGGAGIDPAVSSAHRALNAWSTQRILAVYPLIAGLGVAATYALTRVGGLPNWVWWIAAVMAVVGLPVLWNAARHERDRARATLTGITTTPMSAAPWRSGRSALRWGAGIAAAVAVLGAGWFGSRALGIGPAATLLTSGTLTSGDRLLLVEFGNSTSDSTLGPAVTEALRIDLAQSRSVRLIENSAVRAALTFNGYDPDTTAVRGVVATVVAAREGAKAILTGDISAIGSGYVLTASLVDPANDSTIETFREDASNADDLIPSINRLSRKLRGRIGESLRDIRGSEPLDRVTTASLPALRLYSRANFEFEHGRFDEASSLLEQAVAVDSGFAMAWRRLAVTYSNSGLRPERRREAAEAAYRHRERMPPIERHLAEAYYHSLITRDREATERAYRAVLAIDPTDRVAVNNLGITLNAKGQFQEALDLMLPAITSRRAPQSTYINVVYSALSIGDTTMVDTLATMHLARFGDTARAMQLQIDRAFASRNVAAVDSLLRRRQEQGFASTQARIETTYRRADAALMRGRFSESVRVIDSLRPIMEDNEDPGEALSLRLSVAVGDAILTDNWQPVIPRVEAVLRQFPLDSIAALDRPYGFLGSIYARAGMPDGVRRFRDEYLAAVPEERRGMSKGDWDAMQAIAERRYADAARLATVERAENNCHPCGTYRVAQLWDLANNADSALAWYTRAISRLATDDSGEDQIYYAPALLRLGEMYADRGNRQQAISYLQRFLERWRDADPSLQPMVKRGRDRLAELVAEQ